MNRYLSIPLGFALVGFVVVYFSQNSLGNPGYSIKALNESHSNPVSAKASPNPSVATKTPVPLTLAKVKVLILDQWPTLSEIQLGSRMGPTQSLYATLGELAQQKNVYGGVVEDNVAEQADEGSSFLCTLHITAQGNRKGKSSDYRSDRFPVHVDRFSGEAHIFADANWQEYSSWRDQALPEYKAISGFKTRRQTD